MSLKRKTPQQKINNLDYNLVYDDIEDPGFGKRHIQAVLLFTLIGVATALRSNMTIAILAMTEKNNSTNHKVYDWDKEKIGYMMSSAGWGDIVVQFFAGSLANKYGSKIVLTISTAVTGVLMMLTPWFADVGGWVGVCVTTSIQGAFQGVISPCTHTLLGKWAPLNERTRFGMFVYAGMYTALIITPPIAAFICTSSLGWPWSYYIFGGQSFVGCILWMCFGASSPAHHKSITQEEKQYIEKDLDDVKSGSKIPVKSIMTSIPFIALIITQCGCLWGFAIIYIETPTFFKLALGMDLENSGLFTSLGYSLALALSFATSFVADYVLKNEYMSLTSIRKLSNTIGSWLPALCMVLVTYIPVEYISISVAVVITMVGLDAVNSCGFWINHIDLSPNYAGVLIGIASFFSGIVGSCAPIMTGYLVKKTDDVTEWRKVYMLAAAMYFVGNFLYLIFGSANTQKWNNPDREDDVEKDTSNDLLQEKEE